MLQKNGKHISWEHVRKIYREDMASPHLGVSICHKLSKQHLYLTPYSKMRVYLAAQVGLFDLNHPYMCCSLLSIIILQVMSSTVADALTYANDDTTTETRVFIRLIDKFFDCLNVRSHLEGFKKRKPSRLAYVHSSDERFKVDID